MKKKKYRRLSEKITLTMALWLIGVTVLATIASYLHISSIVTHLIKENLHDYITIRGERESQSLALAERNQQMLVWRLVQRFENPDSVPLKNFDQVFTRNKDGAIRENDLINNQEHPSYFFPKFMELNAEKKKRALILYDFMDRECLLSLATFNNCWVADVHGSFGTFFREKEGYSSRVAADFRNMDQVWMTAVSSSADPERTEKWTKMYFDPFLNNWMITLVSPVYVQNEMVAVIGYDMFISELFRRIINIKLDGTKNFLMSADGDLIAHPDYQEQIQMSDGSFQINHAKTLDPTIEESFKLAQKEIPFNAQGTDKKVFDLDEKYYVAMTKLDGPDWYLATLYPKELISAAALTASRFIIIFGTIGLILELFLLMHLVSRRLNKPLKELMTVVTKVGAGDLKAKVHTNTKDEFEILGNAFNEMTYNLEVSRNESHQAMEKAITASKAKSQFVANMSHEMRTPLNGILGMTHFLNDTNLTEEQKKYATFISESGNNLLNIINQVLDVSKIEAKRYELEEVEFNLEKVLMEVKDFHFFAAKQKGLPIDFDNRINPNTVLWGDVNRLKQILGNLIGNAIKFSDVGTITVIISGIAIDEKSMSVRISVKDQGIGISDEAKAKLFEQFSQADGTMSRKYGGTGLGLFLVKSFVHLMSGQVGVFSHLGQGSEFWFEVPLKRGPSFPVAPEIKVEAPKETRPVLVVEDNFINQVFTEALIKKLGLTSVVANNGQIAVELFEPNKFCLVLMDCQMPVMDGYESTKEIRKKEADGQRVPIIALTANTENKDRETCLESGMDDMLSKPVKVAVFKEKIDYWLANSDTDEDLS